ncbi:unnamed protein product [Adineta steineri]|uniref:Uncharacterized protein n=1 Tax=Adineta steineri TaxID=433720 RepID=A0A814CQM2_9BILA|nr:unnamed protein product [Adineta steineri]
MRKPVIFTIVAAILVVIAVVITLSVVLTRKSGTKDVVTLNTTTTIPSVIVTTVTTPPTTTVVTTTTVVITPPPPTTTTTTRKTTVVMTPPPPATTVTTTTSTTTVKTTISTTTTVVTTTTVLIETTEAETTTTINEPCQVEFETRDEYSTGPDSLPVFVSFTDINDDNRPDIIVANSNGNNIGVFFNTQDGYFHQQVTYPAEYRSYPQYISVVDINDDNKPDIIVANNGGNSVGVLLNNGSGQFHAIILYPTGNHPSGVAVADVNNDKKPDIVVTNQNANIIGVILNIGHGQFSLQPFYDVPYGFGVMCPQLVDVNDDAHPDIIVANPGGNSIGIFFNSGNGTFISWTTFSTGMDSQPSSISVVDVNGDNKPDIIVANFKTSNVGVLLNAGNGKFLNQTIYSTGFNSQPRSVFVADINCDNKPDIIVANSNEENIGIFLNFGNGTFQPQIMYATGGGTKPWSVAVGNVNDDNKPDIIYSDTANHQIVIFIHS